MKKYLLIGTVLFFSCQSKTERERDVLEKNIYTYFQENLKVSADSGTYHLDSVRLIKIDTITSAQVLLGRTNLLYDKINENQSSFIDLKESSQSDIQMARLASGVSPEIYKNSMENLNSKTEKMKNLQEESSTLMKTADSLTKLSLTADSIKPIYYQAKCLVQYRRKDLSVNRDTIFAFLDLQKNIVRKEDVLK